MGNLKPTDIPPSVPDPTLQALDDSLPPPYSEHEHDRDQHNDEAPQYDAPFANQILGDSKNLQGATIIFPPAMNGYIQWKLTTTFHLGPTAEEKLFAVSTGASLFKNKPSIVLYNGPTNKDPILATSRSDKWGRVRPIDITLCPRPGSSRSTESVEQMIPSSTSHTSTAYTFEINTDDKGTERERFEWRSSHGNEIKQLPTGHSYGWKLVRLSGPINGAGGNRKERDMGISSDGLEIVALLAHNASMSMTKGFRFVFMGTGLTGTLGEDWEVMTVVTALQFWYLDIQGATPVGIGASTGIPGSS